jgi:hypothetical protein
VAGFGIDGTGKGTQPENVAYPELVTMQKILIGLSALALVAVAVKSGADRSVALPDSRDPQKITKAGLVDRPVGSKGPVAPQHTWQDTPSLMDSSWRQWPPLTDF